MTPPPVQLQDQSSQILEGQGVPPGSVGSRHDALARELHELVGGGTAQAHVQVPVPQVRLVRLVQPHAARQGQPLRRLVGERVARPEQAAHHGQAQQRVLTIGAPQHHLVCIEVLDRKPFLIFASVALPMSSWPS